MSRHLKTSYEEYQAVEKACKSECIQLRDQIKILTGNMLLLQTNMVNSREREIAMEKLVQSKLATLAEEFANIKSHKDDSSTNINDETKIEFEAAHEAKPEKKYQFLQIFKANQQQIKQSQERVDEMQREIDDARSNINDLILEIEAVSAEESNTRAQNSRLLSQITESQSMQRDALEENLKLQNQIENLRAAHSEMESKYFLY
jgi:chromosome segregation ATPase